jgi:transposase
MMALGPATRIYLASGATDLRKSFEGLSDLVAHQFGQDVLSGFLFVFANRRKNRVKIIFFDGSGIWVCAKRLMGQGTFAWPTTSESGALRIAAEELTLLLRPWWRKEA